MCKCHSIHFSIIWKIFILFFFLSILFKLFFFFNPSCYLCNSFLFHSTLQHSISLDNFFFLYRLVCFLSFLSFINPFLFKFLFLFFFIFFIDFFKFSFCPPSSVLIYCFLHCQLNLKITHTSHKWKHL